METETQQQPSSYVGEKKQKLKKPVVIFCELRRPGDEIINISSQNGAEGVVTRMLPKSHVSHVILNANVSEERFLDMKVSTENKMQKKSLDVHDHFINTFIKRLERKQQRWMKEDNYVSKNLQHTLAGRQKTSETKHNSIGSLSLPTPPSQQATYRKANYPYASVNRLPKFDHCTSKKGPETLPRIQTVPAGRLRQVEAPAKRVKLPPSPHQPVMDEGATWNAAMTNQRADTASTVATRMTGGTRRRMRSLRNYDNRFSELMNFLSPIDARKGPMYKRRQLSTSVAPKAMFGMSLV